MWVDGGAGENTLFIDNIFYGNNFSGLLFEIGRDQSGYVQNNIFYQNDVGILFRNSGDCLHRCIIQFFMHFILYVIVIVYYLFVFSILF